MGDDKKLDPKMYNLIIDNFLNGTPLPKESTPYEDHDSCYHSWILYTGLIKTEYVCELCNKKKPSEDPVPHTPWSGDTDGSF